MSLDEAEKRAHEMLDALRREYELQAAPYIKILSQINALRPRVFYVPDENGKLLEMIPLACSSGCECHKCVTGHQLDAPQDGRCRICNPTTHSRGVKS